MSKLSALEVIRDEKQRGVFIVNVHSQFVFCTTGFLAKNLTQIRTKSAFNFQTLVLLNAQTLSDTDSLLASSLCHIEKVILTGLNSADQQQSILARLTQLAPQRHVAKLSKQNEIQPCEITEVKVKNPEGALAI